MRVNGYVWVRTGHGKTACEACGYAAVLGSRRRREALWTLTRRTHLRRLLPLLLSSAPQPPRIACTLLVLALLLLLPP